MRTVDLSINWLFYIPLLCVSVITLLLSKALPSGQIVFTAIALLSLGALALNLGLALIKKRYLHIDKAGISYIGWLNIHYLHAEHIQRIEPTSMGVKVKLSDGGEKTFWTWKINQDDLSRAEALLS